MGSVNETAVPIAPLVRATAPISGLPDVVACIFVKFGAGEVDAGYAVTVGPGRRHGMAT